MTVERKLRRAPKNCKELIVSNIFDVDCGVIRTNEFDSRRVIGPYGSSVTSDNGVNTFQEIGEAAGIAPTSGGCCLLTPRLFRFLIFDLFNFNG